MSSYVLKDAQRTSDYQKRNQSGETVTIKFSSVSTRALSSAALKGLETNASKRQSLSRLSTRRFTRSHVVEIGNIQSANFTGMNGSAVIPAWGLRRPSVDLLATYLNVHRVSSANIVDITPTDRYLFQGVSYCDALIEECDLGANKTQVKSVRDQQAPRGCGCDTLGSFGVETLANNPSTENVNSSGKEVTTSRTVHLRIIHTSSLSRKVLQ